MRLAYTRPDLARHDSRAGSSSTSSDSFRQAKGRRLPLTALFLLLVVGLSGAALLGLLDRLLLGLLDELRAASKVQVVREELEDQVRRLSLVTRRPVHQTERQYFQDSIQLLPLSQRYRPRVITDYLPNPTRSGLHPPHTRPQPTLPSRPKAPAPTHFSKPHITLGSISATISTRPVPEEAAGQSGRPAVIVTALLDIGRGEWTRFTRPYDVYLDYLNHLIRVPNPIIIFGDEKVAEYVKVYPKEIQARIQMVPTSLKDLPFYADRAEIADILREEQQNWHSSWPERFRSHPEAWSADYNIVVNSKSHFLYRATQISRFRTDLYAWVDAGYSHGDRYVFPRDTWYPELPRGKITLLQVSPPHEKVEKYELTKVYRQTRDVLSGGFLAGDKPTVKRFHVFFIKTFYEMLDQRKVDDDQTTLLMTLKNYRSTFHILSGAWLDAFKVVPRAESARQRRRRQRKRHLIRTQIVPKV